MLLSELLISIVILLMLYGLGLCLERLLKMTLSLPQQFLLGAGSYSLLIGSLGQLIPLSYLSLLAIVVGLASLAVNLRTTPLTKLNSMKLIPFSAMAYLSLGLVWTIYPSSYFDPLNYHLFGAIRWTDLNRLQFITDSIQIMHNSYADYLFIPVAQLFDRSPDSLISLQVCSQLIGFFLGVICFTMLSAEGLDAKFTRPWIGLFVVVVLSRASLQHKAFIAKNDWIALSWFLAGTLPFILRESKKELYLGAFFLGLSVGSKFTYLLPAGILFLGLSFFSAHSKRVLWSCLIISLLVSLPYFLRNFFWTSNPFYPMKLGFFPAELGPSWNEGMKFFGLSLGGFDRISVLNKLTRIFTYEPLIFLFPVSLLFIRNLASLYKFILLATIASIFMFMFGFGPNAEIRHFGPVALSINFFAGWALYQLLLKLRLTLRLQIAIRRIVIAGLFLNPLLLDNELNPMPAGVQSGVFLDRTKGLVIDRSGFVLSKSMEGAVDSSGTKLGLIDDTPPFFFTRYRVSRIWDDPELDSELDKCLQLSCVLVSLKQRGFTHLIDTEFSFDPYYRPHILSLLRSAILLNPQSIILKPNQEKLISLEILSKESGNG